MYWRSVGISSIAEQWTMDNDTLHARMLSARIEQSIQDLQKTPSAPLKPSEYKPVTGLNFQVVNTQKPNKTNNIKILLWLLLFKCLASSPSRFKSNVVVDRIRMSQLWLLLVRGAPHHCHPSLLESVERTLSVKFYYDPHTHFICMYRRVRVCVCFRIFKKMRAHKNVYYTHDELSSSTMLFVVVNIV